MEGPAEGSPEEATWQPGRVMGGCKLEPQQAPGWARYTAGAQKDRLTRCFHPLRPLQVKDSPQSNSFPRVPLAREELSSAKCTSVINIAVELVHGEPGSTGGSQPFSDKTEWFWNPSGKDRERSELQFFLPQL